MSLTAAQINTFHMVATCCLANLGSQLAKMEKICDPSYKCLEEKAEYVRMLLSEICGYIPDGEEVLPYIYLTGKNVTAGDTIQILVDGEPIMNVYVFVHNSAIDVPAIINAIEDYGTGFVLIVEEVANTPNGYLATLIAPEESGSQYSNSIVTATTTGTFDFYGGIMTTGIDAVENNCIDYDDMEKIMRKIATELNICSPFESLPETTLLTNPCGCC